MKLSVIYPDNRVVKDGVGYVVGLPSNPDIWAIQWNGETGEIEYRNAPPEHFPNEAKPNGIAFLTPYLSAWQEAYDAAHPEPTFEDRKAAKKAEITAAYDTVVAEGAPWTFNGVGETLQMRVVDITNWLVLKGVAEKNIAAGQGEVTCWLPVRATSNAQYTVTNNVALEITEYLIIWGLTALGALWGKKDAVDAAVTQADLDAIEVDSGWPA